MPYITAKKIADRVEAESFKQSEGEVIAGVGVSGGTTEQDVAIVEAAMR